MGSDAAGPRRYDAVPASSLPASEPPLDRPPGPQVRINGGRLMLRCPALFDGDGSRARRLIDHAFLLDEVQTVAVRPERGEIGIDLMPLADAGAVWRRLGTLVRRGAADASGRASRLDLKGPTPGLPVRIARAGDMLTTFRARVLSHEHLRIGHPQLRDRDIRHRFVDMLRTLHGVSDVRAVGFRPLVVVTYDAALIEPEHILRLIEGTWPEIVGGSSVAPRQGKFAIAGGLLAFSFLAQFFRPVLLPWATAAVVLYSLPNLIGAVRELMRGRIGLYALYAFGLGCLLWTRLPFASSLIATFRQLWPSLAQGVVSDSERRLFAEHRRRLTWARVDDAEQGEVLVDLADLTPGSTVVVRAGDFLPVDGVVVEGYAALDEDMLSGARGAVQRASGDPVYAGSFVRDGVLTLQVSQTGSATAAAALARALPRGALTGLPSSAEVERIADRNAKPALAAAAALLLATRTLRLSQIVIRPDYATAPRLSAHLSALNALAQSLGQGALVRRPAALDLLSSVEAFVFDDGADFSSRAVVVKKVNVMRRSAAAEALGLAAAAFAGCDDPRGEALKREREERGAAEANVQGRRQRAGETVFWDDAGAQICVATPSHALRAGYAVPASTALHALMRTLADDRSVDPAERPLVVARDRRVLGVVQFAREGEPRFAEAVAALRAQNPDARFVRLSSVPQAEVEAAAEGLGFDAVFGGLGPEEKAQTLRSLGLRAIWVGDGADRHGAAARAASAVTISLGGLDSLARDEADIVLLRDELGVLVALRSAVDAHVARLSADYRTVYVANFAALAGGFAGGFGSLGAGLTSNIGSGLVLFRRWRELAGVSAAFTRLAEERLGASALETAPKSVGSIARRQK